MRSLDHPPRHTGLKRSVCYKIRSAGLRGPNRIHKTLTSFFQKNLQFVCRAHHAIFIGYAMIQHAGVLHEGPRRLLCFVAAGPVHGPAVVTARINELKTAAATVCPSAPAVAIAIGHLIHHH